MLLPLEEAKIDSPYTSADKHQKVLRLKFHFLSMKSNNHLRLELTDFIATHPYSDTETVLSEPSSLVGKEILHKFQVNSGDGSVV